MGALCVTGVGPPLGWLLLATPCPPPCLLPLVPLCRQLPQRGFLIGFRVQALNPKPYRRGGFF